MVPSTSAASNDAANLMDLDDDAGERLPGPNIPTNTTPDEEAAAPPGGDARALGGSLGGWCGH